MSGWLALGLLALLLAEPLTADTSDTHGLQAATRAEQAAHAEPLYCRALTIAERLAGGRCLTAMLDNLAARVASRASRPLPVSGRGE